MSVSEEKNRVEDGTLYLVATPVGNLADISERAAKVLREVSFVAAEDTRVSGLLLRRIGSERPLFSYHEHNKKTAGETVVARLLGGESCALVTDAGTPGISDPGADLVRECIAAGVKVTSVPGCCAAVTALVLSGFDTRRFVFEGFLPPENSLRRALLDSLASERRTVIIYEAPHRIKKTVEELCRALGENRRVALCRELTKLNEEILRVTLGEARGNFDSIEPRGEYVIIIEGAPENAADAFWTAMTVPEHVAFYERSGLGRMDAMKAAARDRGVAKGDIYREMVD